MPQKNKVNCYTTSTKTTHSHRKSEVVGPCGPCPFINLVGIKGSFNLEKKLAQAGRLKPFHISDYTSFLVWGEEFNKDFMVYTSSRKIPNKAFRLMQKYEGISDDNFMQFKNKGLKQHDKIDKKFSFKIHIMKNPLLKLNLLLEKNYNVAVLTSAFYFDREDPVPHWIVAYKKEGQNYLFKDSANGLISLTKSKLEKGWEINKEQGFYPQFVAYKEKN